MRKPIFSYMVTKIALANVIVNLSISLFFPFASAYLKLNPIAVVDHHYYWQLITNTFMFYDISASMALVSLLFNSLLLIMFGLQVEEVIGKKNVLFFYIFTGVGSNIAVVIISYWRFFSYQELPFFVPGVSGALFALLVAFAYYHPNAQLLLFFLVPVRAKYIVFLYIVYEVYLGLQGGIASVGVLGGLIFAFLYFLFFGKRDSQKQSSAQKIVSEIQKKNSDLKQKVLDQKELERKRAIITTLRETRDLESLSDDDFQFVKYCHIMYEDQLELTENIVAAQSMDNHQFISEVRHIIDLD